MMVGIDRDSRVRDVYAHPVGRDVIDKILLQTGRSRWWVVNPVVANLRLGHLERLGARVLGSGLVNTLIGLLNEHPERPSTVRGPVGRAWWKSAVFHQVYPPSFQDSDGDGMGDLAGISARLGHLVDLGVDCLWLTPVFDSPNEDMGYDIRNYRTVMAQMGTLAELDALIAACHSHGMRIILDLVVNHTSAEHPWFRSAEENPDGPYGDYYFLRGGEPGEGGTGKPPNNWISLFLGSAWRWLPEAGRWGLHLWSARQMDLNWDNPAVRGEMAEIVQFWMARGVDGFRLDAVNLISKEPGLPSGDPFIGDLMEFTGVEHYVFGPRLHGYLRALRRRGFTRSSGSPPPPSTVRQRLPDGSLGGRLPADPVGVMVGEPVGTGIEMGRLLAGADRGELDLVFNKDVLDAPGRDRWDDYRYDLNHMKAFYQRYVHRIDANDWIALFIENHDNPRMVSKVLGPDAHRGDLRASVAKVLATIQLTLQGSPFIFQGQEIGAINQDFTDVGELRDVESLNRFAELRSKGAGAATAFREVLAGSRDHARVPMRWEPGLHGGFTTGTPWLPGAENSTGYTVAEQAGDPTSVLSWYRDLIRLRRGHEAFTYGSIRFIAPRVRDYFAWYRVADSGERWLVEVNLANHRTRRRARRQPCDVVMGTVAHRVREMAPYEVTISRVRRDLG